jgi:hypothetical protein
MKKKTKEKEQDMARSEQRLFTTLDIYLTGFLTLHGISPKLEIKNARVVFTFEANDQLYRLMNLFNSNINVPVADFVTIVKTLRGKMLTVKEGIDANGKGARNGYPKDF